MVTEKKSLKSAKRYGARYGRTIKLKVAEIEKELRKKHSCPYCHYKKVKRLVIGIWHCDKCKNKFTAKAYAITRKITFEKKPEEEAVPITEEKMEENEEGYAAEDPNIEGGEGKDGRVQML